MDQIRDKILFEKLKILTVKTIDVLTRDPNRNVPLRPIQSFSIDSDDGYTIHEELKKNYYSFVSESMKDILDMPEYQEFAKYILNNKALENSSPSYGLIRHNQPPYRLVFALIFCSFMEKYFNTSNSLLFQDTHFLNAYLALEGFFFAMTDTYTVTSPLAGFYSIESEIILNENLRIKELTESDKTKFIQTKHSAPAIQSPLDGLNIFSLNFALETT